MVSRLRRCCRVPAELSGGKFSLKDLAKGVGKAADIAIPLAQAFGVEGADQAAAINTAIRGAGFGRGTQKKCWLLPKRGLESPIN